MKYSFRPDWAADFPEYYQRVAKVLGVSKTFSAAAVAPYGVVLHHNRFNDGERTVVENDDFDRQFELLKEERILH